MLSIRVVRVKSVAGALDGCCCSPRVTTSLCFITLDLVDNTKISSNVSRLCRGKRVICGFLVDLFVFGWQIDGGFLCSWWLLGHIFCFWFGRMRIMHTRALDHRPWVSARAVAFICVCACVCVGAI